MFTDIRLRIRHFFKKNSKIILVVLIIWLLLLIANIFLKNQEPEIERKTTYEPHTPIMDSIQKVPEKLKQPINELIETYFNYCNSKQYENAYHMLSQTCKDEYFPSIEIFKQYVDIVFNEDKIYYIQDFSNKDNVYIYRMRILEDIMKTGLTGKKDLSYYEEKVIIEEKDGQLFLSIREHITTDELDGVYEDDYIKIWLEEKAVGYETEKYTIKIKNKTSNYAVLVDGTEESEALLKVGIENRKQLDDNLTIVLLPEKTETYELTFTKFYDEADIADTLIFGAVRILKNYTGLSITREEEMKNAVKLYSIQIPL